MSAAPHLFAADYGVAMDRKSLRAMLTDGKSWMLTEDALDVVIDALMEYEKTLALQSEEADQFSVTDEQENQQKIAAFKADLEARGETVADFCRRKGLDYNAMSEVLRGRSKGRRGQAHKVCVALGLKRDPSKTHA